MRQGYYKYVITIEKDMFIADIEGDPGRTDLISNAIHFDSEKQAEKKIQQIQKKYTHKEFVMKVVKLTFVAFDGRSD